ncbi:unnamed protein product [Rotaria sordida]|uniref:Uncharacterized protein n=1 Tax=Rotaria sordida TaxID=392033 RepID=A0A814CHW0_9BILA|nr:unnamed protein product [Rotaria sordida]CAF0940431.1 unnamed protein product [Rotaria sordida]
MQMVIDGGLLAPETFNRSISDSIGRPDLGRSSNDMSPSRNLLNQSRHVRSATTSSPSAAHILRAAALAFIVKSSSISKYPPLSIWHLPSIFFSSILTKLNINVRRIHDCFHLLDGRLKQLKILIVEVGYIDNNLQIIHNTNELPNLKSFSLTYYYETNAYDNQVIPLLRRMTHLEKLTLYIRIDDRSRFVDGTNLHKNILIHMPRLHTFTFYISTDIQFDDSVDHLSDNDIQQTAVCNVFSLPFTFNRLEKISNKFPNIIFNTVTYLIVGDVIPFKYEFFIQIAKAFPSLKDLCIINVTSPLLNFDSYTADNIDSCSSIQYLNLTSLTVNYVDNYYIEQFLLDTKTYAPHLTEIKVHFDRLQAVTENFTRDATRYNCRNIKRFIFEKTINYSNELYLYFPSLLD